MRTLFLACALVLFATAPAQAQLSKTQGFQIGASVYGNGITIDFDNSEADFGQGAVLELDEDTDFNGGGLGLRIGYGFSPLFTLYADLGGGAVDFADDGDDDGSDNTSGYLEIGGEFSFGAPDQQWVPFVNVALQGFSFRTEGDDDDLDGSLTLSGGGLKVGGGVNYFFTPQFAARLSLDLGGGALTRIDVDADLGGGLRFEDDADLDDASYTTGRLHLGVTYRF